MVHQTFQFLLRLPMNSQLAGFVFFSTLTSYSFHCYFTSRSVIPSPRINWLKKYRYVHIILFFTGLSGVLVFFYQLHLFWAWLIPPAIATFLYSAPKIPNNYFRALRKFAFGKTFFLTLVWTYVTTILPVIITETPWRNEFTFFALSRFFLIYCICILFDYRDKDDDKEAGLRSLIIYLDEKKITYLFFLSVFLFFASTAWMIHYNHTILNIILLLIPGIIVALLYNHARKNFSDYLYYVILDGLMALSALLMLIARI